MLDHSTSPLPFRRAGLSRRAALLGLTAAWTLSGAGGTASLAFAAAPPAPAAGAKRLVVVVLRGALDGLAAVVPYGDRSLSTLRPELIPPKPGTAGGMLDLGGFFGLHPALPGLGKLYAAGQLLPIHAVAGPYRSRSHFDAQDCLETGLTTLGGTSGWLDRAAATLPGGTASALGLGLRQPVLLVGQQAAGSWAAGRLGTPPAAVYSAAAQLAAADHLLGPAIAAGLKTRAQTTQILGPTAPTSNTFGALAGVAGTLLAAAAGPRIAAIEIEGWDTHENQATGLPKVLTELDAGLTALRTNLVAAWSQTVVLVMTEFGRTVMMNGTKGTDHGTGGVAFVLGGGVAGGRVAAAWPGLASANLYQGRDLQPTTDLRAVIKGVLSAHLGLSATALATVFPQSDAAAPMAGLLHA